MKINLPSGFANNESNLENNLSKIVKIPLWINEQQSPVFCWLHLPESLRVNDLGIILCAPLGYEHIHSHRTYHYLANELARRGYAVIRFDFLGSGDSAFDAFYGDQIVHYLENIETIQSWLKENIKVKEIALVGLRTGGTIAAQYCSTHAIEHLVLWQPYSRGRAFVREMTALEKVAGHDKKNHENFVDSGGFVYSNKSLGTLNHFNLLQQDYKVVKSGLLIERDDVPDNPKLMEALQEKLPSIEHFVMHGFLDMMGEPHESVVPLDCVERIVQYFTSTHVSQTNFRKQMIEPQSLLINGFIEMPESNSCHSVFEKIYNFADSDKNIFAILSQPKNYSQTPDKPLLIFINSGSVHHVGPNRIYVESARALAANGFASLRVDLSTLGDSVESIAIKHSQPYPENAVDDINWLLDKCRRELGFKKIILSGICSGAYHSWHSSLLSSDNILPVETILINPLVFYRDELVDGQKPSYHVEKESNYYSRSIRDFSKWKGLFSGRVNLVNLLGFLIRKCAKTVKRMFLEKAQWFGMISLSRLALDHIKLADKDIRITYFLATNDPGYNIIMANARRTINRLIKQKQLELYMIKNADHTFSSYDSRQSFIKLLTEHLLTHYPV